MFEFNQIKEKELVKWESKNRQLEKQNSELKKKKSKYQTKISDLSNKVKVKTDMINQLQKSLETKETLNIELQIAFDKLHFEL